MKPIKIGYKIWRLSDNDGYIYKFQVHVDKTNEKENNKFGLGGRVVIDLTKHLEGKYHKVYFDNFFFSVPLFEYLHLQWNSCL